MTNIPFPNPHDADALNSYLDALATGVETHPENDVEATALEFHRLASRAEVKPPTQPTEHVKGTETMHTATLAAPISNRTGRQMKAAEKQPNRSYGWLSAVIVAGLMLSMIGSAWLNREPGNPHQQLAFAPGTVESATFVCPVTLPNHVNAPDGLDHYAVDGHTWFEGGIWISIPTDGVLKIGPHQQNTDPQSEHYGWGFEKLIVLRGEDVEGMVDISGQRLDQESELTPFNDPGANQHFGETGFVPIALMIPGEGCWEFTATVGDSSATWVADVRFIEEFIWTQPISFTECPDDAERNAYDPENPSGTMYSQEDYDQISSERSYEIIGPADSEDAKGVVTRMRETKGCYYEGKSTLKWTARFEYETRTTAGRESVDASADQRSDGANGTSIWLETETGLTYRDLVVYQDPDELSLDGTEAVVNSTLFNPDQAVEFADGRIGLVPSIVTYDPISEQWDVESVNGMNVRLLIFIYQDGEWMLDENLPICIGDCSGLESGTGVGGDVPELVMVNSGAILHSESDAWWWDESFDEPPFVWTAPITYDECPQDEVLPLYDRENPSGALYTQEDYDQVSSERDYEIVGPADADDALAIVTRMRQAQACTERSQALPYFTDRLEYESRTTAGRQSLEAIDAQRIEGAIAVADWYEDEPGLTPEGMWVLLDPEDHVYDPPVALRTRSMYNPEHAVQFADGRIGIIHSVVTYEPITHDILPYYAPNMTIWANVDGEWMIDENLAICFGECELRPDDTSVGGDNWVLDPSATPVD